MRLLVDCLVESGLSMGGSIVLWLKNGKSIG